MHQALPEAMLAPLERLGADLLRWAQAHRASPLAEIESAVVALVRAALPDLLHAVLTQTTPSLQPVAQRRRVACPSCGKRCAVRDWRTRSLRTIGGEVAIERPWYHCRRCRHGFSPTDATLEVAPHQRLSAGLHAWLVTLGATTTFAEAAQFLDTLTGLTVSPETVRQHTAAAGGGLEDAQQDAMATVQQTREAAEPVDAAPGQLVVETDGVMVRYRETGWHEVKIGVVGGQVDGNTVALSYVAAREPAAQFGPRLLAEAARRGALDVVGYQGPVTRPRLARLRPVVVLGDGAVWIWNLADEHFGERVEIVDFWHAGQHLWTVARALHGEGTDAARAWAEAQMAELWAHGAGPILKTLGAIATETPEVAEVLRQERGYFRTNAARMAYPRFRAAGYPIGSGAVESGAKQVVQQRMKRAGMRWSAEGAQRVLAVRTRLLSHRPLAA